MSENSGELVVPGVGKIEPQPKQERPLLSVALGNVILTPHGAEITLVFPREVVFTEEDVAEAVADAEAQE